MSMDLLDLGSESSGIGGGPTFMNRSCNMMMMNNVAAGCSGGVGVDVVGQGQPVDLGRKQQHFDSVSKSPGGMAFSSTGFFPFTNAQWKELERQAMVFKYMMHSIPVPYDLLFPFISASTNLSGPSGMMIRRDTHLLKFLKTGDPEPGRCKRTDGKKWRCSNGVALDQKYCEKHVHRGRPRSRKHVEATAASDHNKIHKKPCLAQTCNQTQNQSQISPQVSFSKPISCPQNGACYKPGGFSNGAFQLSSGNKALVADLFPQRHLRNGGLSEEQWNQLMHLQQHQQLSLSSYTHQPKQEAHEINMFLNPNLKKPTSGLIDAWTRNGTSNVSNTHHDMVSLGLSMGQGSYNEDDVNKLENKPEPTHDITNWMTQSGGPLGEVLRPPSTHSPTAANGGASSTSCIGVLREAVASLSDSTRHTSSAPSASPSQSHSGFQWFDQDNHLRQNST